MADTQQVPCVVQAKIIPKEGNRLECTTCGFTIEGLGGFGWGTVKGSNDNCENNPYALKATEAKERQS